MHVGRKPGRFVTREYGTELLGAHERGVLELRALSRMRDACGRE